MTSLNKKRWISTRSVSEWDEAQQKYVLVSDEGYWYDGPMALAHDNPTWDMASTAFYNDGTESGSTIIGTADTQQTLDNDTTYFCRALQENPVAAGEKQAFNWEYNHAGGGWTAVTTTSSVIIAVTSSNVANADDTTNRLGGTGTFITDNNGVDDTGSGTDCTSAGNDKTEALLVFQIVGADVTDADEILLRCTNTKSRTQTYTGGNADIDVNKVAASYELNLEPGSYAVSGVALTATAARTMNAAPDSYAVTGVALTLDLARGVNLEPGSYAVTGDDLTATATRELNLAPDAYAVTGVDVTFTQGFEANLEAGSFAVTGAALNVLATREVNAEPGTHAVTGAPATFEVSILASFDAGSYALTGAPVTFEVLYNLNLEPGSFAITGAAATFTAARELNVAAGSYAVTGAPLDLSQFFNYELDLEPNSIGRGDGYRVTGAPTTFLRDIIMSVDAGSYAVTGFPWDGEEGYTLNAAAGSYALTGVASTPHREVDLEPSTYAVSGVNAHFIYSGQGPNASQKATNTIREIDWKSLVGHAGGNQNIEFPVYRFGPREFKERQ